MNGNQLQFSEITHGDSDLPPEVCNLIQLQSDELLNLVTTDELRDAVVTKWPSEANSNADSDINVGQQLNLPLMAARQIDQQYINTTEPYVTVVEQPRSRHLRFRYKCEGRSAGSIAGENSRPDKKTAPTIKVHNYTGPLVVVVSCVTNESKPRPHPHLLVGSDCKNGVCTVKVKDRTTIQFTHLGIQCARKKDIPDFLAERQRINVDPFSTGFGHEQQSIDLNVIKLCFQVFLPDDNGSYTRILKPVCSNSVFDKKAVNDLTICRIDKVSGSALGGEEVFVLCDKVAKDDIAIVFQELHGKTQTPIWENFGEFGAADVHKQYAIVFKTPPYRDIKIRQPVDVEVRLKRPSDGETSAPINFIYMPQEIDHFHVINKKRRNQQIFEPVINQTLPYTTLNPDVKERIRLKATRKIKDDPMEVNIPAVTCEVSSSILPDHFIAGQPAARLLDNDSNPAIGNASWLENLGLHLPTQVTDAERANDQYSTLELSAFRYGVDDPESLATNLPMTSEDEACGIGSLTNISSGDLITGNDPEFGRLGSNSSDYLNI